MTFCIAVKEQNHFIHFAAQLFANQITITGLVHNIQPLELNVLHGSQRNTVFVEGLGSRVHQQDLLSHMANTAQLLPSLSSVSNPLLLLHLCLRLPPPHPLPVSLALWLRRPRLLATGRSGEALKGLQVIAAAAAEAVGAHTHMWLPLSLACQRGLSPGSQLADDATYQQLLCLTPAHTDRQHGAQQR